MKGEKLKLERPLVVIDLETTGLDTSKDRIVEIAAIKRMPDGEEIVKCRLINPTIPIPKEASEIHGITDEKVKNEYTFKQLAPSIALFIDGCDIAGYNSNHFDIPLLLHEFERAGIYGAFENVHLIDIYKLYSKFNPRTLEVAFAEYCGKKLDAHSAKNDALATLEVFEKMLAEHSDEIQDKSMGAIAELTGGAKNLDVLGWILQDEQGNAVFGKGKHKGKKVLEHQNYCEWILKNDFTENTKAVIRKIFK